MRKSVANRREAQLQSSYELDRAFALTLAGISRRAFITAAIGVFAVAAGVLALMMTVAHRLYG